MIKLLGKIPQEVVVACSGGIDSMVLLDFLSRKHRVNAAFFHHGTNVSEQAMQFVHTYCSERDIPLIIAHISQAEKPKKTSKEEHWRNQRYSFLSQFQTVATAHHLDDVAETWIWSSLHGTASLLPHSRGNVIRPLLLNRKAELQQWAINKNVPWIEDTSNLDCDYTRNYIRHQLMPHALRVNPGLHTMLRKKLIARNNLA